MGLLFLLDFYAEMYYNIDIDRKYKEFNMLFKRLYAWLGALLVLSACYYINIAFFGRV
jgi:hypothetical protein